MATPDKQIIIKGKRLLYGTSVKCSPEINNSSTPTFDGNITAGLGDVGWNIEIETARYETAARHQYLSDLIESKVGKDFSSLRLKIVGLATILGMLLAVLTVFTGFDW